MAFPGALTCFGMVAREKAGKHGDPMMSLRTVLPDTPCLSSSDWTERCDFSDYNINMMDDGDIIGNHGNKQECYPHVDLTASL
jgi:hypothetical protein